MKISCDACRQKMSEQLDHLIDSVGGNPAGGDEDFGAAEVWEHFADCPACQSDFALLSNARRELRAFPIANAPADLRACVRRELEAAPVAAVTSSPIEKENVRTENVAQEKFNSKTTASTPRPAPKAPLWYMPAPEDASPHHSKLHSFLSRPTNVIWASCVVLFVCSTASMLWFRSRPAPKFIAMTPSITEVEDAPVEPSEDGSPPIYVAPKRALPGAGIAGASKTKPGAIPPLQPGRAPFAGSAPGFGGAPMPLPTVAPFPALPKNRPGAPSAALPPPAPQGKPQQQRVNVAPPKGKPRNSGNNSSLYAARSRASEPAADSAGASGAGLNGPPSPATSSAMRRETLRKSDDDQTANEAKFAAPQRSASASSTREISTQITPPRSLGWAQVSVNLPEGARFSDGTRARVVWRGSAQSNEPIDVSFSVQAESGANDISIKLQEVKNGNAQTVASKSVGAR